MDAGSSKKQRGKPFQKGVSGNPSGREKLPDDIVHVRELARQYTQEAVNALAEVLRSEASPGARVSAAQALLDRGWGKSEATVNMNVKTVNPDELTDAELAAIAAGGRATADAAQSSTGKPDAVH
jgi:hypothetical protein